MGKFMREQIDALKKDFGIQETTEPQTTAPNNVEPKVADVTKEKGIIQKYIECENCKYAESAVMAGVSVGLLVRLLRGKMPAEYTVLERTAYRLMHVSAATSCGLFSYMRYSGSGWFDENYMKKGTVQNVKDDWKWIQDKLGIKTEDNQTDGQGVNKKDES